MVMGIGQRVWADTDYARGVDEFFFPFFVILGTLDVVERVHLQLTISRVSERIYGLFHVYLVRKTEQQTMIISFLVKSIFLGKIYFMEQLRLVYCFIKKYIFLEKYSTKLVYCLQFIKVICDELLFLVRQFTVPCLFIIQAP